MYQALFFFPFRAKETKKQKNAWSQVTWSEPGPCTAFSQSLSVNSRRWHIRGEWAGNASHFRLDHVTQNALATRQNEA